MRAKNGDERLMHKKSFSLFVAVYKVLQTLQERKIAFFHVAYFVCAAIIFLRWIDGHFCALYALSDERCILRGFFCWQCLSFGAWVEFIRTKFFWSVIRSWGLQMDAVLLMQRHTISDVGFTWNFSSKQNASDAILFGVFGWVSIFVENMINV